MKSLPDSPSTKRQKVCFQETNFSPGIENDRAEIGVEVPLTGGFGDSAANNDRLFQDLVAEFTYNLSFRNVLSTHLFPFLGGLYFKC